MSRRRVGTVSLEALAKSVDAAVKLAAARHKVAVERDTLLDRWEIIGRRLRDIQDMNAAEKFASDVSRKVKLPGVVVTPIVAKIDKDILVGFIERSQLPTLLSRG